MEAPTVVHEHNRPMDKQPTRESVTAFIKKNIVTAKVNLLACGDGRYSKEQSKGGLRMFGGDMGALAAFWKVGKENNRFTSVQECVAQYQEAKARALKGFGIPENEARKLYLHTDSHGDEANGVYGCGHMKNLTSGKHAGKDFYDTDDADMRELFQYVVNPDNHIDHELMPLAGTHAEKTVIYVHGAKGSKPSSAKYTVNSSDETGEMHFVVDYDRVVDYFNRLASALPWEGVTGKSLLDAYQKQELTTARILAPNMQVVHAYITDQNNVEVDFNEEEKVPAI